MIKEDCINVDMQMGELNKKVSEYVEYKQVAWLIDSIIDVYKGKYSVVYEAYRKEMLGLKLHVQIDGELDMPITIPVLTKMQFDYICQKGLIERGIEEQSSEALITQTIENERLKAFLKKGEELLRLEGKNAVSEVLRILQGALDGKELSEIS